MDGIWYNRTAFGEARRRGERVSLEDFAERELVTLSTLPCCRLGAGDFVRRAAKMVPKMVPGEWRWMEAAGPRTEALPHLVR